MGKRKKMSLTIFEFDAIVEAREEAGKGFTCFCRGKVALCRFRLNLVGTLGRDWPLKSPDYVTALLSVLMSNMCTCLCLEDCLGALS